MKLVQVVYKYLCWNCGLWQGDEDELETPSDVCPSCKKAARRKYE